VGAQSTRQFKPGIGDPQIKAPCDRAGDEKKELAARFEKSLPQVTRDYLARVH
jgi:hypothetical protein